MESFQFSTLGNPVPPCIQTSSPVRSGPREDMIIRELQPDNEDRATPSFSVNKAEDKAGHKILESDNTAVICSDWKNSSVYIKVNVTQWLH